MVNAAPYAEASADKIHEINPSNPWNSSANSKMAAHKGGSVATADGNVIYCYDLLVGVTLISVAWKLNLMLQYFY